MGAMDRYRWAARAYDRISAEPVYRPGRLAAVAALGLDPGARILDVGCGTGLNLAPLLAAAGSKGRVVGLDQSAEMLAVAAGKTRAWPPGSVRLVQGDAQTIAMPDLNIELLAGEGLFDAAIFTYSLSLMPHWERAWSGCLSLVREGGRVAVADMAATEGRAALPASLARVACWAGGADIMAHPWTAVERDTETIVRSSLRRGHIQIRVGAVSH